ncbi:MAG: GFA family protein [Chromatiaceae bacterium]
MPAKAVEFTGDLLATYEERANADSAPFYRSFCSRCGSPISGHGDAYPGIVFLKAGTLDDTSWVSPIVHIWCAEKQPWVTLDRSTPQLPAGPGS